MAKKLILCSPHDAEMQVIKRRLVKILAHNEKPFDSTLFKVPVNETPQLVVHPHSKSVYESRNAKRYTCYNCSIQDGCEYAFDSYNTNGDCLNSK